MTKTNCPAKVNAMLCSNDKWCVSKVNDDHNHVKSPSHVRSFRHNREVPSYVQQQIANFDKGEIGASKSFNILFEQAEGPDNLCYLKVDVRNCMAKARRLRLGKGDASAIQKYFSDMQKNNSRFYYAFDLDDDGFLRNVFWANERSRMAYEEFGDVITFDTTYLTNNYEMPFAPFIGVTIMDNQDRATFTWLFETWLACMGGRFPIGIVIDQDRAMKIVIENVFSNSRHRLYLWHIMKKLPEKLGRHPKYESIKCAMKKAVYETLTSDDFERSWNEMIEKFQLEKNQWLHELYLDRNRWIPAYLNNCFWAGISSTQRSESMNAFFDGYVNSKTTLKQFVEQYEIALRDKVEKEKQADSKSCNKVIVCTSHYEMEKQFQEAYTHNKFEEFQDEMKGKMYC